MDWQVIREGLIPLLPGDIVLTRAKGSIIGWLIRLVQTDPIEAGNREATLFEHVGLIVSHDKRVLDAIPPKVKLRKLLPTYEGTHEVAIFRHLKLEEYERNALIVHACKYKDRRYGFLKIAAAVVDWWLSFNGHKKHDVYLARRLCIGDQFPQCAWLIADAYESVDRPFDTPKQKIQPDDIWDEIISAMILSNEWRMVFATDRLEPLIGE